MAKGWKTLYKGKLVIFIVVEETWKCFLILFTILFSHSNIDWCFIIQYKNFSQWKLIVKNENLIPYAVLQLCSLTAFCPNFCILLYMCIALTFINGVLQCETSVFSFMIIQAPYQRSSIHSPTVYILNLFTYLGHELPFHTFGKTAFIWGKHSFDFHVSSSAGVNHKFITDEYGKSRIMFLRKKWEKCSILHMLGNFHSIFRL